MRLSAAVVLLVVSMFTVLGCGGGGGSDGPAIATTQYAAMTYEIVSDGIGSVFGGAHDNSVVAIVVNEPVHIPDADGVWSAEVQAYYIPMGDFGTFTPDNPATVTVTVTRVGNNVTVVATFSSTEIFRIDNAVIPPGGETTATHVQDGDTYQYILTPWANTAPADLVHNWNEAANSFTEITQTNINITATDTNGITATIDGRVYTGRRVGSSAFLIGTGAPDTMIIIEDLGGTNARGYLTGDAGGEPHTFDDFTLTR